MGTWFSRRAADDTVEYYDSKESLLEAKRRENSEARAGLFGLIGLLAGGAIGYFALQEIGMELPKWLRFGLVIASGGTLAYVFARLADFFWNVVLAILLFAVLWGIGSMIWSAV